MSYVDVQCVITRSNVTKQEIRHLLYKAFWYDQVLANEKRLQKEFRAHPRTALRESCGVEDGTFAENRIRQYRQRFLAELKGTNAEKLVYLSQELSRYPYANELPRVLLDVIAPEFFGMHPTGEIWFVVFDETTRNKVWADERTLRESYSPDSSGSPHEMSGLEGGLSLYHWLQLMLQCFYPFVNGVVSSSDARLVFLLLPDRAINSLAEYQFDLYRATQVDLIGIYTDSIIPASPRGIKSMFPSEAAILPATKAYFKWYIDRCAALTEQLMAIGDLKRRFVTTLTLNRLAIDTRIIQTSHLPYLMKLLLFGVLDKYANLYVQLGLECEEEKVWQHLLAREFYENEVEKALGDMPGQVGETLRAEAHWIYEHLADYGPAPEVMRQLRNSYHGYGISKIDVLLGHSGEVHNDIPALANVLWHWLLSRGLPDTPVLQEGK